MVAEVVGPEKVDATREDGAARGSDVSKRLCSIDTKAMEPSDRPARRNLEKAEFKYLAILFWQSAGQFQTCYMEKQQMCGLSRGTGGVSQTGSLVKIWPRPSQLQW